MEDLLMNQLGITETKVAILDLIIVLAKKNNGFVGVGDLEYIKKELIKQSSSNAINDALNLMESKEKESANK